MYVLTPWVEGYGDGGGEEDEGGDDQNSGSVEH